MDGTQNTYLFTTERLGFRNWTSDDLTGLIALNADKDVMRHFPKTLSPIESENYLKRLQNQYKERGYTYFAVDLLETGQWIGFIGLAYQDYTTKFTPAVDIGWRLLPEAWGKGYATEGAKACLTFAFETLGLDRIVATCTKSNRESEHVMRKIGMTFGGEFSHPKLNDYPEMQVCKWYEIRRLNHL